MRGFGPLALVLVLCSSSVGVGGETFPAWLLAHHEVRLDIGADQEIVDRLKKLDESNKARIEAAKRELDRNVEEAKRSLFAANGLPTITPKTGARPVVDASAVAAELAKLQATIQALDHAYQTRLDEIDRSKAAAVESTLTPAQAERVRRIERRFLGTRLFIDPATIDYLNIEVVPAARMARIVRDEARKLDDARAPLRSFNATEGSNGKPLTREEFQELYHFDNGYRSDYLKLKAIIHPAEEKIREDSMREVLAMLTPDQRRRYDEWIGEPFDAALLRRRLADPFTLELPNMFLPETKLFPSVIVPRPERKEKSPR